MCTATNKDNVAPVFYKYPYDQRTIVPCAAWCLKMKHWPRYALSLSTLQCRSVCIMANKLNCVANAPSHDSSCKKGDADVCKYGSTRMDTYHGHIAYSQDCWCQPHQQSIHEIHASIHKIHASILALLYLQTAVNSLVSATPKTISRTSCGSAKT